MAFLTDQDYKDTIQDDILDMILDSDATIRAQAELKVQSEMESYLAVRYDVANIFNKSGSARNQSIVMKYVDMAIYRIMKRIAPGQIPQHINDSFGDALDWLKSVAASKLSPDLPEPSGSDEGSKYALKYGSVTKRDPYY